MKYQSITSEGVTYSAYSDRGRQVWYALKHPETILSMSIALAVFLISIPTTMYA